MSVGVSSAEPAAGPAAAGPPGELQPGAWLRLSAWVLGGVTLAGALLLLAAELAAARVPQHRAALEQLIRYQTGLEVSFRELSVRWGWYGPEAVFDSVVLGEPRGGGALLRAPQLIVGLDLWRLVRSAELQAARITLVSADIDLGPNVLAGAGAPGGHAAPAPLLSAGGRLLARWRGGRIDLQGGTLRWPSPHEPLPLILAIRHAQLRRQDGAWSADALVLLPASLGASAHLALQMQGDPARPETSGGTLSFEGRMLEFAGWRALGEYPQLARYLPQAGRGNLELRTRIAHGQLQRADGKLQAAALQWSAPVAGAAPVRIERLRGAWQLQRDERAWSLTATALELEPDTAPVSLSATLAADAQRGRCELKGVPLPLLAELVRSWAPQLPLAQLRLDGVARELALDWDAARPAGTRLQTHAQLEQLSLESPARDVELQGLTARVTADDAHLRADLEAADAQLRVVRAAPLLIDQLGLAARVTLAADGAGWQIASDDFEIRRAEQSLAASGRITATAAGAPPHIQAHLALQDVDAALLARLAGPATLASLGAAAVQLAAGRISNADLEWRGPLAGEQLPWNAPATVFRGALELRAASFTGTDAWPDTHDLNARLEWRGPQLRATIDGGRLGTFQLVSASADWDARGARATHLTARLNGSAQQALVWVREHPQLAAYAPGVEEVDLRGEALLDVDLLLPAAAPAVAAAGAQRVRSRIAAVLDGAQLRALPGLPPIEALRGTLGLADGHLQPSTLTGQWLGGPVSLSAVERREAGGAALAISARGLVDAHQAILAAGARADVGLAGNAEWSALLTFLPGTTATDAHWRLRADSSLVGVASELPEPFAKPEGASLPLRLEVQAGADQGQLRVSLGERLRVLAGLTRSGELWRIERGTVRLAATAPALPAEPVLMLEGRVGRLDLPAYLALWRQAAQDAALPALRAHLSTAQLVAGERSFAEVSVTAQAGPAGGALQLESADLAGSAQWPAAVDAAHPAVLRLARLEAAQLSDAALGAGLIAALGSAARLSIEQLSWQGRSLGAFSATLAARPDGFDLTQWRLVSDSADGVGSAGCRGEACQLEFSLDSHDAAATLAQFGFRAELTARRASLAGKLEWPRAAAPSLASLEGSLHMQLEQGSTHGAAAAAGAPFALFAVPALTVYAGADNREAARSELAFARLTADYALHGGEATTSDLHFDGDAEILVHGRLGLTAQDYDAQAWVLRGEERLPAALRRLGPTPKVAALWLSLRGLFEGSGSEHARAALHLHGSWDEPIVTPAE